jgi:hypothetical protein
MKSAELREAEERTRLARARAIEGMDNPRRRVALIESLIGAVRLEDQERVREAERVARSQGIWGDDPYVIGIRRALGALRGALRGALPGAAQNGDVPRQRGAAAQQRA